MGETLMPDLWEPAGTYLNTASYGLPPRPAWDALQEALEDWRSGRTSWEHWGIPGEDARANVRAARRRPRRDGGDRLERLELDRADRGVGT